MYGLRFTAKVQYCTGGWLYTGTGGGWSGATVYLFRDSDGALLVQQFVPTGAASSIYPFVWTAPQPLVVGADYTIAINNGPLSGYAGAGDGLLPPADAFIGPVAWLTANGSGVNPTLHNANRVGIFPQLCTSAGGYCSFGTQPKPATQFLYYLTPGIIDVWLAALGMPWLAPIFTALWFTSVDTGKLCAQGPPDVSFITSTTPASWSSSQIGQLLSAIAWSQLCQCAPGSPAPIPYPPPTIAQPTGWVVPANPSCANVDTCTFLELIYSQLAALSSNVAQVKLDIERLQRYSLPFAYIGGAVHSGLSGDGQFAISRLLGVKVTVTSHPATFVSPGNPPYIYNLGWVGVETADGLLREQRVAHDVQIWLPTYMPMCTLLAYHFNAAVVASIQELQAEP
jgi:hypothetical protein